MYKTLENRIDLDDFIADKSEWNVLLNLGGDFDSKDVAKFLLEYVFLDCNDDLYKEIFESALDRIIESKVKIFDLDTLHINNENLKGISILDFLINKVKEADLPYNLLPLGNINFDDYKESLLCKLVDEVYNKFEDYIIKNDKNIFNKEDNDFLKAKLELIFIKIIDLSVSENKEYVEDVKTNPDYFENPEDALDYSNRYMESIKKIIAEKDNIILICANDVKDYYFSTREDRFTSGCHDYEPYKDYSEQTSDDLKARIIDKSKNFDFSTEDVVKFISTIDKNIFSKIPEDEFEQFISTTKTL